MKKGETKKNEEVVERFKPEPVIVSSSSAKQLLDWKGSLTKEQLRWIDRWLKQLVQERSWPPQVAGQSPYEAMTTYLTPSDCLAVLSRIRSEFEAAFPLVRQGSKEELVFLNDLVVLETQRFFPDH